MELILDRWFHIMAGIVWIGLLYYFNFVQAVALPKAKADNTAAGITKHIAPQALLWFRWAALVTWLTGAWYLERSGIGLGAASCSRARRAIGLGTWLGTIMLFNVGADLAEPEKVLGLVPPTTPPRPSPRASPSWPRAPTPCCHSHAVLHGDRQRARPAAPVLSPRR